MVIECRFAKCRYAECRGVFMSVITPGQGNLIEGEDSVQLTSLY